MEAATFCPSRFSALYKSSSRQKKKRRGELTRRGWVGFQFHHFGSVSRPGGVSFSIAGVLSLNASKERRLLTVEKPLPHPSSHLQQQLAVWRPGTEHKPELAVQTGAVPIHFDTFYYFSCSF